MDHKKQQDIQTRIEKLTPKKSLITKVSSGNTSFNIATEIVAGMIVGVITGLFFDNLFDSKPVFLIICLILAMVATFRSIWNKNIKNNGA